MPNIIYHVIYCHEGQRSKCKELKLRLSEVCEELQAAPGRVLGTALLDQESSHCLEVGTPSVSGGPRFLLPVFWCVTIIICSEVLNFNVTYTTLVLYCPTSLLCEVCEGLLTAVFKASLPRSEQGLCTKATNWFCQAGWWQVAYTAIVQQLPALLWVTQNLK